MILNNICFLAWFLLPYGPGKAVKLELHENLEVKDKAGELLQIKLRTGEVVRGHLMEKVEHGIRLSQAYITKQSPETADTEDSWVPCLVIIEIPYDQIEKIKIVSLEV